MVSVPEMGFGRPLPPAVITPTTRIRTRRSRCAPATDWNQLGLRLPALGPPSNRWCPCPAGARKCRRRTWPARGMMQQSVSAMCHRRDRPRGANDSRRFVSDQTAAGFRPVDHIQRNGLGLPSPWISRFGVQLQFFTAGNRIARAHWRPSSRQACVLDPALQTRSPGMFRGTIGRQPGLGVDRHSQG